MSDVNTVLGTRALQAILRSAAAPRAVILSRPRRLTSDLPAVLRHPPVAPLADGVPTQ
jgi:hypothetical protein